MKGLNRAYLIGHVGHDPELRNTATGLPCLKLSLGTPNEQKVGEEWVNTPDWHHITAFGKDAEFLSRVASKGDILAVECVIRPNRWTDKESRIHYDVSLVVERILWVQSKRSADVHLESEGRQAERPAGKQSGGKS